MRNKFLSLLMAFVFLAAIGTPVLAAPMHQGRPTAYESGSSAGYHIWQEGERWHVRTVNAGTQRLFTGMIETDGTFADVTTVQSEKVERVAVDVSRSKIEFHFNSMAKADGFSFTLQNSQNATVTLYIDGRPVDTGNVYLGRQNRHPGNHSFPINPGNDNLAPSPYTNSRFQGQPTALNEGNVLGYFIWQEGERWILKTTTKGAQRNFTGTIKTAGQFSNVTRLQLEDNDFVRFNEAANEISFDLKTAGEQDGLTFQMSRGTDATFTLYLDGQPINTANIYLGAQNQRPTVNPFNLNSNADQYGSNDNRVFPSDEPNPNNANFQTIGSANAQGQPTALNPGKIFGYFLWQDAENRWILQTTTTGEERQFSGTIESTGTIYELKTLTTQRADGTVVDAVSNKINYSFKTGGAASGISISLGDGIRFNQSDKVSGLSFRVTEGAPLNFTLNVDGQPIDPANIYLGSANRHPAGNTMRIYSSN